MQILIVINLQTDAVELVLYFGKVQKRFMVIQWQNAKREKNISESV